VELARAFVPNRDQARSAFKQTRAALEKDWPNVPGMREGDFRGFTPYAFLHRSLYHWLPTPKQQAAARAQLPYLRDGRYAHLRADDRHANIYLFVRRPNYYAAFNAGEELSDQQRFGLGLLWSPDAGALVQAQSASNDEVWGTKAAGHEAPYEAASFKAKIELGKDGVQPKPGRTDLGAGDLLVSYPLGETGHKTIRFDDDRIRVETDLPGTFTESVPLLTREPDQLRVEAQRVVLERNGRVSLTIELAPGATAELSKGRNSVGPYQVTTVKIASRDKLSYSMVVAPGSPARKP
jgi:hypothetical protein